MSAVQVETSTKQYTESPHENAKDVIPRIKFHLSTKVEISAPWTGEKAYRSANDAEIGIPRCALMAMRDPLRTDGLARAMDAGKEMKDGNGV